MRTASHHPLCVTIPLSSTSCCSLFPWPPFPSCPPSTPCTAGHWYFVPPFLLLFALDWAGAGRALRLLGDPTVVRYFCTSVSGVSYVRCMPSYAFVSNLRDEMGLNTRSTCREGAFSNVQAPSQAPKLAAATWYTIRLYARLAWEAPKLPTRGWWREVGLEVGHGARRSRDALGRPRLADVAAKAAASHGACHLNASFKPYSMI